jgi:hypothetical protein
MAATEHKTSRRRWPFNTIPAAQAVHSYCVDDEILAMCKERSMREAGRLLQPEEIKAFRKRESWTIMCPLLERNGQVVRCCDHVPRLRLRGRGYRARKPFQQKSAVAQKT